MEPVEMEPLVEIHFSSKPVGQPDHVCRVYPKEVPFDVNTVADEARESNTSYKYSGRHDHGTLPTLKSTGTAAQLFDALMEMKQECDKYLTDQIAIHMTSQPPVSQRSDAIAAPKKKKLRLAEGGTSQEGAQSEDIDIEEVEDVEDV